MSLKRISSISMEEIRMTRSLTLQVSYFSGISFVGGASGRDRLGEEPSDVIDKEVVGWDIGCWECVGDGGMEVEGLLRLAAMGLCARRDGVLGAPADRGVSVCILVGSLEVRGLGGEYCVAASTMHRTAKGSATATAGMADNAAAADPTAVMEEVAVEEDVGSFVEGSGRGGGAQPDECDAWDRANVCRFDPL